MTRRILLAALMASVFGVACETATAVPEQVATVGCGMCRFQIPNSRSCYWAIELQGKHYPVVGANQPDHDSHAPGGMCVMDRQAKVVGKLKRGQFIASQFELIDVEVDPNAAPPPHEHNH